MIKLLAARRLRRLPALVLVACLLPWGVPVTSTPVRDGSSEGMSANSASAHSQLIRAPLLRAGSQPCPGGVALPSAPFALAEAGVSRAVSPQPLVGAAPPSSLRAQPRSRAPPATT